MFAIPLFWLLPAYLAITVISPCLLSRQSNHGNLLSWSTPKVRYFSIEIPALVTLGLAVYSIQQSSIVYERTYCLQSYPQPYLALASSILVLIETYITYRLDIQLPPHMQQQPDPDSCGKSFCFHKCVSSNIQRNLSSQSPLASTYCSTVRLLRNLRIVASVAGTLLAGFVVALLFINLDSSLYLYEITAHIITLFLWLLIVISTVRPTVTRPALDLHPVLRFVLTLFSALALLSWTVICAMGAFSGDTYRGGEEITFVGVGYSFEGVFFSILMALEAIWTFKFDRRRYNTARKVQIHKHRSQHGGVELVDIMDDGKFLEPESYDGKIEAPV
ncbi:MAG: hypothetical protein JOS17DRAFT_766204 [Linnemannia elongata]|nr:MAG: hypothetical protein JOS17DRAFT_766204 [Linnemannia elongata]